MGLSPPDATTPVLIAITGGSGSGKSTLAEAVVTALPTGAVALIREDSYYRDAASPVFGRTRCFEFGALIRIRNDRTTQAGRRAPRNLAASQPVAGVKDVHSFMNDR